MCTLSKLRIKLLNKEKQRVLGLHYETQLIFAKNNKQQSLGKDDSFIIVMNLFIRAN